ncbi:MAG: type III pantothenate kinase, partial [Gallionella sp.]|nr:type III pantothenate kinase [Gallionella sp.]
MKRLLIDAGNTRIKLATVTEGRWSPVQAVMTGESDGLAACLANFLAGGVQQVWVSNVAGSKVGQLIATACASANLTPRFIASQARQCGVGNGYVRPEQLGCDRWAALIAAWHQLGSACLVVNSGTATTIDALSARGEFIGGLILPGVELMQ